MTVGRVEWLERLVGDRRHCWRRCMARQYLTSCHAPMCEFQRRIEDRRVERCFPVRLPPECRSERDAPVGVLIGRN